MACKIINYNIIIIKNNIGIIKKPRVLSLVEEYEIRKMRALAIAGNICITHALVRFRATSDTRLISYATGFRALPLCILSDIFLLFGGG